MAFYKLDELSARQVNPGFLAKFVHSERMSIGFWEIAAGSRLPEHSHMHEQVSYVMAGRFEFTVGGETRLVEAGSVVTIPANVTHSGLAITDCRMVDAFSPVREDYR